jgi:hypothetical protein
MGIFDNFIKQNFEMRKILAVALGATILLLTSCGNKGMNHTPGVVTLKINAMFGSNPLHLNQTYQAPNGTYYNISKLRFYLSHIKLVRADHSSVEVQPWYYVALDDTSTLNIPLADSMGTFTGLQFSIGVDSIQNNTDPSSLTSQNLQLEGTADSLSPPTAVGMLYHVGTSPYYTTITLNKSFSIVPYTNTTLTLSADIQKIFYGAAGAINPYVNRETQTLDNPSVALTFINDFDQTFSIQ